MCPNPTLGSSARRVAVRAAAGALMLLLAGACAAAEPWPPVLQADAPAYNSATFEVIEHGGLPATAALAWQGVLDEGVDRTALTLALSPGLFVPALRGSPPRVAATLTVGGPLQRYDLRHAQRAARLTNHVTSDLAVRLGGVGGAARRVTLTGALTADNLATGYGFDRYGATLIAERPGRCALTGNAGVRVQERYHLPARYAEVRLGAGTAWRPWTRPGAPGALVLGLAAGTLIRNEHRPAVLQASVRLDAPLAGRWRATASFRLANRPDLGGDDLRTAVMGIACDLFSPGH